MYRGLQTRRNQNSSEELIEGLGGLRAGDQTNQGRLNKSGGRFLMVDETSPLIHWTADGNW